MSDYYFTDNAAVRHELAQLIRDLGNSLAPGVTSAGGGSTQERVKHAWEGRDGSNIEDIWQTPMGKQYSMLLQTFMQWCQAGQQALLDIADRLETHSAQHSVGDTISGSGAMSALDGYNPDSI